MEVPIRWLKEFVHFDLPTEEIAHRMTMAGLEAEKVTKIGEEWDGVFVGEVIRIDPHPDADRLVIPSVVAGEHSPPIVTGAPNIKVGQKVALALAGTELIDPYSDESKRRKLKPTKIRGVRSEGMVCSEKELGISDEHEGIMVLDDDAPVGMPLRDWLGDDVIEFEITPNLVHAFSIYGIARELAAILDTDVTELTVADLANVERADESVKICEPEHCGRFTFTLIENVTITDSPAWMQRRLRAAGLRPINNYVDISNYVMLEVGHPTHPFDADKLATDAITVRLAQDGETMTTIDHVERELDAETLVIADNEKAVGIAGIMGGVDTEVTESTGRILLESAWFYPTSIRRTTRSLKLNTDASARFGRDIDPNGAETAARRFIELVKVIDPDANVVKFADQYLNRRERRTVSMKYSELERLLGMEIPIDRAEEILNRLDLDPVVETSEDGPVVRTSVPTYRNDINLPADLVEEIIRIHGYEHLPETIISGTATQVRREPSRLVNRVVQNALVEAGLQEVQTYSMTNEETLRKLSSDGQAIPDVLGGFPRPELDYVRATNPLRSDWEIMRPTLLPSLLSIAGENLKFVDRVAIFETARTFEPAGNDELPIERESVCIVLSGQRDTANVHNADPDEFDFYDVKGVLNVMLSRLGADDIEYDRIVHPSLHPGRAAALSKDGIQIGMLGELHPAVASRFALDGRVAVAEVDISAFAGTLLKSWRVKPVGRFQPVHQDFAIVVDEQTPAGEVASAIQQGAGQIITDITLFDVYTGDPIPEGKKSLAFRATFSAPDRQPAEHEIERARTKIERSIANLVGGTLRT